MSERDVEENEALRQAFASMGLDISKVCEPVPYDLARENRKMEALMYWVERYRELGSRKAMEAEGLLFPPVEPDYSPDLDWALFKKWLKGASVAEKASDMVPLNLPPVDTLSDEEVAELVDLLYELTPLIGLGLTLQEGVPDRLIYAFLLEEVFNDKYTIHAGILDQARKNQAAREQGEEPEFRGGMFIDGCSGVCPGCFQRPWCESGNESHWPEDEKAGEMFLSESVRQYVSPTKQSLALLRESETLD